MSEVIVWLALRMLTPVEVLGVFETEDKAKSACTQWEDVIGPVAFGVILPDKDWPGAYYPLAAAPTPDDTPRPEAAGKV